MDNTQLKRLFELVKETLINQPKTKQSGICRVIAFLVSNNEISINDKELLTKYLNKNKPTLENEYSIFVNNPYWTNGVYWWKPIFSDIYDWSFHTKEIRIEYLTKLIANIK